MVTKWILDVVTDFIAWVLGLFPSVDVPVWMTTTVPDALATLNGYLVAIDAWLPFAHAATALLLVLAALTAAVALKGVRIVASFLTAGGGSAG